MLDEIKSGDLILEIHSNNNTIHVNAREVKYISKNGRIICGFEPFQGLKPSALNQFNRSYREQGIRGNHLNMFRMYCLGDGYHKNLLLFYKKLRKITDTPIKDIMINTLT